jgi:ketosteroid isomerase-like protein
MNDHPNAELVRRCYRALTDADLESLAELMAPAVEWHEPGRGPFAGDYQGPEGVLSLIREIRERSDGTFAVEIVDLLANAERAVALQEETARRNGRQLDMAAALEFEIHHGQITEVTVYHADTHHFDEFWS